jgi:uncharacterized MAPEG superfamily protein
VHENFVESLPMILTFVVCGAFVVPQMALYVAWSNVIARIIYTVGYVMGGADSRVIGVICGSLPINALGITTIVQLVRAATGSV